MSGDRFKPEDRDETERIEAAKLGMEVDDFRPIRHEVWPLGWGRYRIVAVHKGLGPDCPARYDKATVWGRRRAAERARQLQRAVDHPPAPAGPVFRTDEDPESVEQFVKRLPKPPPGPAPGAPRFGQQLAPGAVTPPRPAVAPASPPPSRGAVSDAS